MMIMEEIQRFQVIYLQPGRLCVLLISLFVFASNIGVHSAYFTRKDSAQQFLRNIFERKISRTETHIPSSLDRWLQSRNIDTTDKHRITVDPHDKLVFWIEHGPPHRLMRSHLQNTYDKVIVVPQIVILPVWLIADYSQKRLYFGDSSLPLIQSVDYNGGNQETQTSSELHDLFLIDIPYPTELSENAETKDLSANERQRNANEILCPATFPHGSIEETCTLHPGSYCTFDCDVGIEPVSYLTMWCVSTGKWSHNVSALCREVTCPDPEHSQTRLIESCVAPNHPGQSCIFKCPIEMTSTGEGEVITRGSEVITCNEHGDWSDEPLSCSREYSYSSSDYLSYGEIPPLNFTARPTDSLLTYGDIKLINCATNDESADIQWFKDDVPLTPDTVDGIFLLSSGTVFISDVEEHHAGIYTCKADSTTTEESIQAQGFYSFPDDLVFETKPTPAFIVVGDDHVIQCAIRDPTLVVSWEKDGAVLQYSENVHKVSQGDDLLIRQAFIEDSGSYTCVAMTLDGNRVAETSADLNVLPQPDIKEVCGTITAPAAVLANMVIAEDVQEGRIVNGSLSIRGTVPWIARLWNRTIRRHFCAGSLINRRWIVTAAHCIIDSGVTKDELIVRVGDFDTYAAENDEQLLTVAAITVHENFNEETYDSDIALIKLAEPVEMFDDFVRPVCIPNVTTGSELLMSEVKGQVVGWGRVTEEGYFSRYMKEIMLQVRSDERCKASTAFPVTNNMFCAGSPRREGDACEGDSGGSFAVEMEGRWFLGGIVSWGEGCAREGKFGFYTKVPQFYEWIHNTIANNT